MSPLMMTFALSCTILLGLLGTRSNARVVQEVAENWETWKAEHDKKYASDEDEKTRRTIWEQNLDIITKHNLEHERGLHSYTLGMNAFGDMKHQEFLFRFGGSMKTVNDKCDAVSPPLTKTGCPTSVDWRKRGYVTRVKNQLECGSDWAFSASGSLEGQNFAKEGELVSLSEQNLVDCSEDNRGCQSGNIIIAFNYVTGNGGIDTEESYPYVGQNQTCAFNNSSIGARSTGFEQVFPNEGALEQNVSRIGPISVVVDATQPSFQLYKSGVYDEPACSPANRSRSMLVVGYGVKRCGRKYWIVKNSMGPKWGMKGYILMSRNKNNQCGIASEASYPLV